MDLPGGQQPQNAGHLDVLVWAREHRCPRDKQSFQTEAEHGHLDVWIWARQHGCAWYEYTCRAAANHGHLDVWSGRESTGALGIVDMPSCRRTWPLGCLDLGTITRLPLVCIKILALLDPIVVATWISCSGSTPCYSELGSPSAKLLCGPTY
jgi:hypothetical protein